MTSAILIPYRDRGTDPLRKANLVRVLDHWRDSEDEVYVTGDGRTADAQFNRSAAYNLGASMTDADVLIFTESDMLLPYGQISEAVEMAQESLGLVVPFTEYRYLTPEDSELVRDFQVDPRDCTPESIISPETRSWLRTGPVNVLSRETLNAVGGYDEAFEGNWWDDRAMKQAFDVAAGPTRWVDGPAYHLFHLPGWTGDHLTDEDRAATARNKARYRRYMSAKTPQRIRELTAGG